MNKYIKLLPVALFICFLFLSIGFSSFSTNLSMADISASIRPTSYIRVTRFYAYESENGGISNWEEYGSNAVVSNLTLPNSNSSVSFKTTITNISDVIMMINSITNSNDNFEYELYDYDIKQKICSTSNISECSRGIEKEFIIKIKNKDGYTADAKTVKLEFEFKNYEYVITFNPNMGTGTMPNYSIGYDEIGSLPANTYVRNGYSFKEWNTKPDGTGESYQNKESIYQLNNGNDITLYAIWQPSSSSEIFYEGECIFNGKDNNVVGACAQEQEVNFINTGIQLFNDENYSKNFIISFTIDEVDASRFQANKRDTIFSALYEENDKIAGAYPGIVLRIEGKKWQLQGGNGQGSTKLQFNSDELIGKEIKIIRHNNGSSIKLYYTIGENGPFLLRDITNLYATFDTPLTFGANVAIDNVTSDRHAYATLSDVSFKFMDDGISLDDMISGTSTTPTGELKTLFEYAGPCTINGKDANITGTSCQDYTNARYINTNVNLFDEINSTKDFDVYFEMSDYNSNDQEVIQATIINAYLERSGATGYGFLLRKNSGNLSLIIRDGSGASKEVKTQASTFSSLRVVKKNNKLCYSINGQNLVYAIDFNLVQPFNVPVTFGSSTDPNGVPWRYLKGTLSNMYIKVGTLDSSVICEN